MIFLPVVGREMTTLARRKGTYWTRAGAAGAGILVVAWMLAISYSGLSFNELGKSLFLVLSSLCFGGALLVGAAATSDCLSEEKREGTLGLLFLTDLKSYDIVFGKLAASSLNWTYALLGMVPTLALALLLGGVTLAQVGLVTVVLLNTLFLSLSAGVWVSALSKNERKAMFACGLILAGIVFAPFMTAMAVTDYQQVPEFITWPSPLYAFLCTHAPAGLLTDLLWVSVGFHHLLGWLFLWSASRILPGTIHDLPSKRFERIRSAVQAWVYGRTEQRQKHRRSLLDRNAFLWLASRERVKPQYAWVIVALAGLLFLWIYVQFPRMAFDPMLLGGLMLLIHSGLKVWVTSEVCSRLIDDRRSGALELLLSSPLSVPEIARGQTLALRRIFLRPVLALIAGELALAYMAFRDGANGDVRVQILILFGAAISTLCLDLWALKWVGLWNSLFGKSIERILLATVMKVMFLPWIIYIILMGALVATAHSIGESIPESLQMLLWVGISLLVSAALGFTSKMSFLRYFRSAAAQRFDAKPVVQNSITLWLGDLLGGFKVLAGTWRRLPSPVRRHPYLSAIACVLLLAFSTGAARRHYWSGKLQQDLAAITAQKGPASLRDAAWFYPPVPARENALTVFTEAGGVNWLKRNAFKNKNPGELSESARETLRGISTANQNQIQIFQSITNYHRIYVQPSIMHAGSSTRDVYEYLRLAVAELTFASAERDLERAEMLLTSLLHLARLCRQEPVFELQNLAVQTLEMTSHSLERIMRENQLPPAFLDRVEAQVEALRQVPVLPKVLKLSRASLIDAMADPAVIGMMRGPRRAFTLYQDLLKHVGSADRSTHLLLQAWSQAIEIAAHSPYPERFQKVAHLEQQLLEELRGLYSPAERMHGQALTWPFLQDAGVEARLAVLQAALRYRRLLLSQPDERENGSSRLAEAVVNDSAPDPFTGQPLKHLLNPDGVRFYSLGRDGDDDLGISANIYSQGDIVFTAEQPASLAGGK